MRSFIFSIAASMRSNAWRVSSTVSVPSAVRAAPSETIADDGAGLRLDLADQPCDLTRRAAGVLGQPADLVGDDGEPFAVLARPGGLDRGVEREQVGLLGDLGDALDDRADLAGLALEPGHRRDGGAARSRARRPSRSRPEDGRDTLTGELARLTGRFGGLAGGLGGSAHRPRHLRRGAVRAGTMRSCASAPVVISVIAPAISATARPDSSDVRVTTSEESATVVGGRDDLADHLRRLKVMRAQRVAERVALGPGLDVGGQVAVRDALRRLLHLAQVGDHVLECRGGGAELAAHADADVLVEIARRDAAGGRQQAARGTHQRLRHREAHERGQQHRERQQDDDQPLPARCGRASRPWRCDR